MSILSNNALLFLGADQAAGYQISRSLRFNSSDSAYLSRTPASAGNRKTWTWAGWVKRGALTASRQGLFVCTNITGTIFLGLEFNGSEQLNIYDSNVSGNISRLTTALFRDMAAWYHILLAYDTTNATADNRVKLYVNGSEVTDFTVKVNPAQNADTYLNSAVNHSIGSWLPFAGGLYFSGYLADIHFIDGQALTPSSFTEVSATTGQLIPKAYTGSFGTNGFHLPFSNNSTAAALGTDTSGNSNTWTVNNISVAAGAGNDSLVDTPTSYGTGNSGGDVRGNYCTWNPLSAGNTTLSNGNLSSVTINQAGACGTVQFPPSGKWFFDLTFSQVAGQYNHIGIIKSNPTVAMLATTANTDAVLYRGDGNIYRNTGSGYSVVQTVSSYTSGDVIGVAVNNDASTIQFYKNGSTVGTAISLTAATEYTPFIHHGGNSTSGGDANFGQRPFAYTAPSGFKALCDTNLPAPVVAQPSTVMDVKLYTGNGSTQTISGLGFSPDLVWIKERNAAADHALYDTVRGVQQQLESNTTTDETTESTGLTAFNSDGFALSSLAQVNTNTDTYVAWCWDKSATAGFDIVTYTGNGSARTISHGLGVAPNMIIVKARTTASTDQGWAVYHSANTANPETDYLLLNSNAATADLDTVWNDTAPTSSVFSVGTNALVNVNNDTYVAYLFSAVVGYSSFGSYTGNGSADGPFVYTGFRPRYLLRKRTDSTSDWDVMDAARGTYNATTGTLFPNLSNAEDTTLPIDFLSNGFKLRTTYLNGSGATYIYCAFAESPFQYARAR